MYDRSLHRTPMPGTPLRIAERVAALGLHTSAQQAQLDYRGCVIHLADEGGCFTVMPRRRLAAGSWEELRQLIDKELQNA